MGEYPPACLLDALRKGGGLAERALCDVDVTLSLLAACQGTSFRGQLGKLAGRSVLIATKGQLATSVALIELDGVARRMTVCPPDLQSQWLTSIVSDAEIDAIVSDHGATAFDELGLPLVSCGLPMVQCGEPSQRSRRTEWVLLTSGTVGVPKMVLHSTEGLTAAIGITAAAREPRVVWGTFYDIRRYGGLQILLRAIVGNASLVLSNADETVADHLRRLARQGATHISGTPSHWRRVLMSPTASAITPRYVRLSGEIADQAVLDSLQRAYPNAAIEHAFASTEAGVGFEVADGREGFPSSFAGCSGDIEIKVADDGSLRIRSPGTASAYLGRDRESLKDRDGFVDTGDMLELRGDRYYFIGRRDGVINVGGLKVHPEEVEAIINRHESVRMSIVRSRANLITGGIVVAQVVLTQEALSRADRLYLDALRDGILRICREALPPYKVPASIRFVPCLNVTPSGKLIRSNP
jgi:acyl-coenzyme A synthetase/AMP-(fatty) acid ligase